MGAALSADAKDQPEEGQDGGQSASCTTRSHLASLGRANCKFALELYHEFSSGKKPSNFIYSPLTLSLGLGQIFIGAAGNTMEELNKCLHLAEVYETQLLPAFAAFNWDLTKSTTSKPGIIDVDSKVFGPTGHETAAKYKDICSSYQIAEMTAVDFRTRPDLARKEINDWFSKKTGEKIQQILPLGTVDRESKLVAVGGIYMRPQWYHQFDPKKTKRVYFNMQLQEKVEVEMMNQKSSFRTGVIPKLNCDVLEMPLSNCHHKMIILLPQKQDGLSKLEGKLTRTLLENVSEVICEEMVDVYIPRFRYDFGFCANDALKKLGIREIFSSNKADHSAMTGSKGLYVTTIYQHVMIEVDESGSDNAAVTSFHIVGGADSKNQKAKMFCADHPFLFYIRDDRTSAILILGRVVRPIV